ncbi:coiled-coil domain-containing protein 94 homolog [Olea europaea var. sylvestris]|uniref:coiled-coil domain-containing protein 94 homolog n=1 Tax=Olea europaea var. sylvestris TaxID=158386 RepID=UPI000C1D69EB|nr:coiled-coil domain-containing protein 94 homolog [Olea europaea var. sylvestris]
MGERKVLNKYYPPDFDPAKIPRPQQPKKEQFPIRNMLPMSIRCKTCGNSMYKGTKFNSRKEKAIGETYLGIRVFRFYIKCSKCSAEITFKTDPQNSDYALECGATRNFEPWRAEDEEKKKRIMDDMGDVMNSLENRYLDSKRKLDILVALDDVKSMNSRHERVSGDSMLEALQQKSEMNERKLEEEDEALIESVFRGARKHILRRIDDEEDLTTFSPEKRRKLSTELANPTDSLPKGSVHVSFKSRNNGKFILKSSSVTVSILKKPLPDSNSNKAGKEKPKNQEAGSIASSGLQSLCQQYGG